MKIQQELSDIQDFLDNNADGSSDSPPFARECCNMAEKLQRVRELLFNSVIDFI